MYINIISGAEITIVDYGTDEDDNYVVLKGGRRLKGDAFMRRYKKKEEEEGDSERKVDFWEVFKVGDEIPLTENQTVRIADEEDDGSGLIATEDVGSGTKRLTDKKMLLDIKEQQDLGFVPGARVRLGSNEGVVREYGLVGEAMIDFGGVVPTSARPRNEADMKAGGYEILSGVESKEMEIREGRFYRHIHSGRTVRVTSSSSHRGTAFEPRAETAGRGILAGMREDDFKEEFEEREFPLGIEMKPGERYLLKDKRRVRLTTVFEALDALQVNYETLSGVDYDEELDIFVDMIEAKIEDPDTKKPEEEEKEKEFEMKVGDRYNHVSTGIEVRITNIKDIGGMPAYNVTDPEKLAAYESECNVETYGADPDCREIYDEDGNVDYRLLSRTVTISEDCHPLRRSGATESDCNNNGGTFTNGVCIYNAIPSESVTCQASYVGCRAYQGKGGADQNIILSEDFEAISSLAEAEWGRPIFFEGGEGMEISSESLLVGGHSLHSTDDFPVSKAIDLEKGATYSITFWAKGSGDLFVSFWHPYGSPVNALEGVSETATKLSTTWKRYSFGPVLIDGTSSTTLPGHIRLGSTEKNIFIDNFKLTQGDFYALKKNSWKTPISCDSDPTDNEPGPHLGCEMYQDTEKKSHALKSFSNLCREEAIGCENVVDTRNTQQEEAIEYNTANEDTLGTQNIDPNDNIIIGADRALRMVLKKENLCSAAVAGCQALGEVKVVDNKIEIGDVHIINNPSKYSETLCQAEAQGCDAFTSKRGVSYFKDPLATGRVCKFRESASVAGVDTEGFTKKAPSGWFKIKSADDETEGEIPCSPSFAQTNNRYGIWKSTDANFYTDNEEGAYTGMCDQKHDQCFEMVDHADLDSKGVPKSYYIIDNKKLDEKSCEGKVSRDKGCILVEDTRDPFTNYSAGATYAAGELEFGKPLDPKDYGVRSFEEKDVVIDNSDGFYTGNVTVCHQELIDLITVYEQEATEDNGLAICDKAKEMIGQGTDDLYKCGGSGDDYHTLNSPDDYTYFGPQARPASYIWSEYKKACNSKLIDSNRILKVQRDRSCSLWLSANSFTTIPTAPAGREKQVTGLGLCESIKKNKSGVVQCAKWVDPTTDDAYSQWMTADQYSQREVRFQDREISGLWGGNMISPYHYRVVTNFDKSDTMLVAAFSDAWLDSKGGDGCKGKPHWSECGFNTDSAVCSEGSCILSIIPATFSNGGAKTSSCRGFPEKTSPFSNKVVKFSEGLDPISFSQQDYSGANICAKGSDCACSYTKKTYGNKTKTHFFDIGKDTVMGICLGGFTDDSTGIGGDSKTGFACGPGSVGLNEKPEFCTDDRSELKEFDSSGKAIEDTEHLPVRTDGICQYADKHVQKYRGWEGYCMETDDRYRVMDEKATHACNSWFPVDVAAGGLDIYNQFETASYEPPGDYGRFWCGLSQANMLGTKSDTFDFDGDGALDDAFTYRFGIATMSLSMTPYEYLRTQYMGIGDMSINTNYLDGIFVNVTASDPSEHGGDIPIAGNEYFIGNDNVVRCYADESSVSFNNFCEKYFKTLSLGYNATLLKLDPPDGNGNSGIVTFRDKYSNDNEDWVLVHMNHKTAKDALNLFAGKSGNPFEYGKGHFATDTGVYELLATDDEDKDLPACENLGDQESHDSQAGGFVFRVGNNGIAYDMMTTLCTDSGDNDGHFMSWTINIDITQSNQCTQTVQAVKLEDTQNISHAFTQRLWRKMGDPLYELEHFYDRDGFVTGTYRIPEIDVGYLEYMGPYGSMSLPSLGENPNASSLSLYKPLKLYSQSKERRESKGDVSKETPDDQVVYNDDFDGFSFGCAGGSCGDKQYNQNKHPFTSLSQALSKGINKLFAVTFGVLEDSSAGKTDLRQSVGVPPTIASFDESQPVGENGFKLRSLGAFNVNEKDGGGNTPESKSVFGIGNFTANLRFAAWADTDQMPLKRMMVEWGDETARAGGSIAKYKNRKPYCGTVDEPVGYCSGGRAPNISCKSNSDCSTQLDSACIFNELVLGNDEDGCTEGYYEYQHVYVYTPGCGMGIDNAEEPVTNDIYPKHIIMTPGLLNGPDFEFLKARGVRTGDRLCIFKPKVQVQDNWGWCNGTCSTAGNKKPGFGGCFGDKKQGPKSLNLCAANNPEPWTEFAGQIIVVEDAD